MIGNAGGAPQISERTSMATVDIHCAAGPRLPGLREAIEWKRIKLQRHEFRAGRIEVEESADHCMLFQLGGPSLVDNPLVGPNRRERFWFGRGQMNLTPAGSGAIWDLKGPSRLVMVYLEARLVAEVAEEVYELEPLAVTLRPSVSVTDAKLRTLCELLLAEAEKEVPGSDVMIDSLGRAMALQLLRSHSTFAPFERNRPVPPAGVRLRRVLEYMREHLDESLPLASLARVAGLSQSHFIRAFSKATGQSPHRYLINLRAQKARELLEHTDLSVTDVSLQCGFEQPSHFATMFRSRTGMSPRDWRSAHRF